MNRRWSRAWWVAGAYGFFATLWIYFSDQALAVVIPDPGEFVRWSVYKGLVFVTATTLLLLYLMQRAFGAVEKGYVALQVHQVEIERLTRLYAARSQVNQAIVMMPDREALLEKICEVLVEHGGFHMVWIGCHDPATHRLVPVAGWGGDQDRIKSIQIYTDDRPENRGPSATAIREDRPYICNDLLNDPAVEPWRAEIRRRGYRAAAVFPIRSEGRVWGTLNVNADEPDFFHDKEISLLTEVTADIAFGLDNFIRNDARRASEARYRTLFERAPDGILIGDSNSTYLDANASMCRMLGYAHEELVGLHASDIIATEEVPDISTAIDEIHAGAPHHREWRFRRKDGSVLPVEVMATRMPDGNLLGMVRDITDRKKTERAWRELNETLERRVADRTADLQTAVARAESADRTKSAFLATMSHELRTPLNSIIGFTGVVLQGLAGPLNPEQTKQLGMVRSSARHLLELISDILDISKIEAEQLEVMAEPFDLPDSLDRVTASIRPMAEKKGLEFVTSYAPNVGVMVGDRRRVEQILLNLLNNAVKFTEKGRVALTVDLVPDYRAGPATAPQPAIRLRVTDTGIGIKSEDLETLFQPFRQIDTGLSRQHDGTGLGLAICRRLAIFMGGEVAATSKWTCGSEFTALIPRQPPLA